MTFAFKDASIDAVLQYVSTETGWIFVRHDKAAGKISAVSDAEVPVSRCLDFLNAALRPLGAVIPNPYSPRDPRPGEILKVVTVDVAKRSNIEIFVGLDPDNIPVSDQIRTQIIPLKAVNVVEVNKELGSLLKEAMADGDVAISTYANSMVMTGRSDGIHRAARILNVIDVTSSGELKIQVFSLKNADATETAKTLNEVFKKEAQQAETGRSGMGGLFDMFRGRSSSSRSSGPSARALAHEMVRITPEERTNSVIVSATEDNMVIIEELITKLDDTSAAAVRLKIYPLSYADATDAAKLITDLFSQKGQTSSSSSSGSSRGGSSRSSQPFWMRFMQRGQTGSEEGSGANDIRAIAEVRTNSVLVAATEQNHLIVEELVNELDRDVDDLLEVKIYRLKNAEPSEMATILKALFGPQVSATQQASGGGNSRGNNRTPRFRGGQQGSAPSELLPSQEVEITSDDRTRSVIVKASRDYISVMDEVVRELDADPVEAIGTYVIPLRNADAAILAPMLQNLLRGGGSGGNSGYRNSNPNYGTQGATTGSRAPRGLDYGTGGGSGSGGGFRRNLGPLTQEAGVVQEEPAQDQSPRGIEGDIDIESDPSTNSLVLRTSPRNFEAIQGVIKDLDRMRPQVLIKVLIADVTLDERTEFGVEGFWENRWTFPQDDNATNRFGTDFPLNTAGFTYLLTGDEFEASLNLFAQEGKLKILATPRILVLDNETATINVGKRVPIITSTTINQLGNSVNSVAYENVGVLLSVTPQINPDGLVTMLVAPEVSDVASAAESVQISDTVNSPTFNVNAAETRVAVRTGTTVVIGGLIREAQDKAVRKIPILGDLPLIGALFRSTTTRTVQRELMIFLTPYVAYTAADLDEITGLERARLKLLDPRDIEAESDTWLEEVRQ